MIIFNVSKSLSVSRLLKVLIAVFTVLYVVFDINKIDISMYMSFFIAVSLLAYLCYLEKKNSYSLFFVFLIIYAFSTLLGAVAYSNRLSFYTINVDYYISNSLYIISYLILIIRCLAQLSIKKVLRRFWILILVLLIVLLFFFVPLISEIQEADDHGIFSFSYTMSYIYNSVLMILFSTALINYMFKGTKESILFFIACLFVFLSEKILLVYYSVSRLDYLLMISSIVNILSFFFLYKHFKIKNSSKIGFN